MGSEVGMYLPAPVVPDENPSRGSVLWPDPNSLAVGEGASVADEIDEGVGVTAPGWMADSISSGAFATPVVFVPGHG